MSKTIENEGRLRINGSMVKEFPTCWKRSKYFIYSLILVNLIAVLFYREYSQKGSVEDL